MGKAHLAYIGPLKFLLILGVVIIHSNIAGDGAPFANAGLEIASFVSSQLGKAFVPSFFVISGYLFFLGVERFSASLYAGKLRSRFFTLVIPYVLWNLICAALLYFKFKVLNFESYGVYGVDGSVDWRRFILGFWNFYDGYPFAPAFWFIRNLICFVVLSPIAYFIGRKWWLTVGTIVVCIIFDTWLFCMEFFIIGASLALNGFDLRRLRLPAAGVLLPVAAYLAGAYALHIVVGGRWFLPVYLVLTLSGFMVFLNAALRLNGMENSRVGNLLIQSTFFIYAFHQCFCSIVRKAWLGVVGDSSTGAALVSYAGSFLTQVAICFAVWLIMRRLAPGLLRVLTGNR
ncbi:MAG: acyltransferase [Muribaculaceae bacterium]|nr:acyltransferase [Muribaculaceae bacterium]